MISESQSTLLAIENESVRNTCALSSFLLGETDIEIQVDDEKGVSLSWPDYRAFSFDFTMAPGNRLLADDARFRHQQVGFLRASEAPIGHFVNEFLLPRLEVRPRRAFIDKEVESSKLVFVAFVQSGDHVIAMPRDNGNLVSGVMTLSVFESVTVDDFSTSVEIDRNGNLSVSDCRRLLERAIEEECPFFPFDRLVFTGIVGGRIGDFGIVYGYETSINSLKRIAASTGGVIINAYRHNWATVSQSEGYRPDGWSNVILQRIQQLRGAYRIRKGLSLAE